MDLLWEDFVLRCCSGVMNIPSVLSSRSVLLAARLRCEQGIYDVIFRLIMLLPRNTVSPKRDETSKIAAPFESVALCPVSTAFEAKCASVYFEEGPSVHHHW